MLNMELPERRRMGIPQRRFMDDLVKEDMTRVGVTEEDAGGRSPKRSSQKMIFGH